MMRLRLSGRYPLLVAALLLAGCSGHKARSIAEIPFAGFRDDIPDAERGNATFDDAAYSSDGAYLVTLHHLSPLLRVWDGRTGALLSRIAAVHDEGAPWLVDGTSARLVARRQGEPGIALFDLRSGNVAGVIPEPVDTPAVAMALGYGGTVIIARPGVLEAWSIDSARRRGQVESPYPREHYRPGCVGGIFSTYNDKHCWEASPGGRWLAMAVTSADPPEAPSHFVLVDLQAMTSTALTLPDSTGDRHLAAFAFSADERWLAVGTDRGVWLRNLTTGTWTTYVRGNHPRNQLLGAMGFLTDGTRMVTLGDLLQVSTIDVATGQLLGRIEPPFEEREGIFRMSGDGSRVVVYLFLSDILEVIDGRTSTRTGWICPYFCNIQHNPVPVAFAMSPDGSIVAASHRYGAGLWDPATDQLLTSLNDTTLPRRVAR